MAKLALTTPPDIRKVALEVIRDVLSEENTDALLDELVPLVKLPFWLRWIPLRSVLDKMLPDALLGVFEKVLGGTS